MGTCKFIWGPTFAGPVLTLKIISEISFKTNIETRIPQVEYVACFDPGPSILKWEIFQQFLIIRREFLDFSLIEPADPIIFHFRN